MPSGWRPPRAVPAGQLNFSWCVRGKLVEGEAHLVAVEVDLEHAVDRLAGDGKLVERRPEQALLRQAVDGRDQNDEARMQRLGRIEAAEVARVIGDEDELALAGVARDVPILSPGAADMRDVAGFMAGLPGDGNQVDREAFVDQKPHDAATVSSLRRAWRTGLRSRQGWPRGRPRKG